MHLKKFWKKTEKKPNLEKKKKFFFSTIKNIIWKKTVFFQTLTLCGSVFSDISTRYIANTELLATG